MSNLTELFVSTGGMGSKNAIEAVRHLAKLGIKSVELSGGKYFENYFEEVIDLARNNINIQIHNYFPVPKKPFVLNLASKNNEILKLSYEHCINAIFLASKLKKKRYSVHAGFCCDPKVKDLGRSFDLGNKFAREEHYELFIKTLKSLKKYSDDLGVDLYVENNNTIKENVKHTNSSLLCSEMRELKTIKEQTGVKALIDIGHLVVSAKSLGLNEEKELLLSSQIANAYHLSTNNRLRDQNKPISNEKYLLKYLSKKVDFFTIEVYGKDKTIIEDYLFLKDFLS